MDNLDEILPYIKNNNYAIFYGAGISNLAGCGLWTELRNSLLEHPILSKEKEDILKNIASLEEQIEYCYDKFQQNKIKNEYINIVRKIIRINPELFKNNYLPFINNVNKMDPFSNLVLTTNIDNCLETTGLYDSFNILYKPLDLVSMNILNKNLLHLHGMMENIDNVLLVYSVIKTRYSWSRFKKMIKNIISNRSILFLGYGLKDKELLEYFRSSKKLHFALISVDRNEFDDFLVAYYLQTYHIKIIKYGKRDELPKLFNSWIDRNFSKLKLETITNESDISSIK